tara:strand:+ start:772 stop:924 length:153 start_codon:yes stop_codon:yes gene_type:complete
MSINMIIIKILLGRRKTKNPLLGGLIAGRAKDYEKKTLPYEATSKSLFYF